MSPSKVANFWLSNNLTKICKRISLIHETLFRKLILDGGRFRYGPFIVKFESISDYVVITVTDPLCPAAPVVSRGKIPLERLAQIYFESRIPTY